jgi:hypothetical protein
MYTPGLSCREGKSVLQNPVWQMIKSKLGKNSSHQSLTFHWRRVLPHSVLHLVKKCRRQLQDVGTGETSFGYGVPGFPGDQEWIYGVKIHNAHLKNISTLQLPDTMTVFHALHGLTHAWWLI